VTTNTAGRRELNAAASPGLNASGAAKDAFRLRAVNDVARFRQTVRDALERGCPRFMRPGGRRGADLAAGSGDSAVRVGKAPRRGDCQPDQEISYPIRPRT
jgi:hypothetical protein